MAHRMISMSLCWATLEKLLRSLRKLKVEDARALAGGGAGPGVANPESSVTQKAGQQKRRRHENRKGEMILSC